MAGDAGTTARRRIATRRRGGGFSLSELTRSIGPRRPVTVEDQAGVDTGGVRSLTLKRTALAAATAFAAINVWTGCPLFALWVAAQVSSERRITMTALGVFLIVVALLEGVTLIVLAWLNNVYDELTGRERAERRPPWLRAMSEESERHVSQRVGISLPERILMIIIYVAVIALAVWYVFFAGTSYLHCIAAKGC